MRFDIVIVGGGLVGASLAAALKDSGLRLALIESGPSHHAPLPADDWDSRVYALTPGNADFLRKCGAWLHLDSGRVQQVEQMRVFGDTGARLDFSAYRLGVAELAFIIENRSLQHALWQVLRAQSNLTLLQPAQCDGLKVQEAATRLTLKDGREIEAGLVVGADGPDSWVRRQAGMTETATPYHQHGVVANFNCARNHRNIAHQWFACDGILALLPLPGRRVSMVWSVSPEKSAELLALPPAALGARVAEAAGHVLGELQVITSPAAFPLRALSLARITGKRLALAGDAAHNVHPLAGQGVNLGLRDARALAHTLLRRDTADCGDPALLRRYEQVRHTDVLSMQLATDALKHLFINDDPLLRMLRNFGLAATNRIVPLKRMLAQHALN